MTDPRFTIGSITQLTDNGVTQTTDFLGDIRRVVVDVQSQQLDAGVRAKLIELGWTPPGEPVPAQGAEGVEALLRSHNPSRKDFTVDEALSIADQNDSAYRYVPSVSRTLAAEVRRLRNSPESPDGSFILLSLLADIRAAAGDPTGKLMQDELVAHIRALREDAERLDELERLANSGGVLLHDGSDYEAAMQTAVGIGLRPGALVRSLRAAIDAARSSGATMRNDQGMPGMEWRWVDDSGRAMTKWKGGPPPPTLDLRDEKGAMRVELRVKGGDDEA